MESKVNMEITKDCGRWGREGGGGLITNLPSELHAGGVHDTRIGELDHIAGQQAGACLAQVEAAVEVALVGRERERERKWKEREERELVKQL